MTSKLLNTFGKLIVTQLGLAEPAQTRNELAHYINKNFDGIYEQVIVDSNCHGDRKLRDRQNWRTGVVPQCITCRQWSKANKGLDWRKWVLPREVASIPK